MESDTNLSRLGRFANIHRAAERGYILGDHASSIDYSCKLRELEDKKESQQIVSLPGRHVKLVTYIRQRLDKVGPRERIKVGGWVAFVRELPGRVLLGNQPT